MASTIQSAHVPVRGLPAYGHRGHESKIVIKRPRVLGSFLAFSNVDSHDSVYSCKKEVVEGCLPGKTDPD